MEMEELKPNQIKDLKGKAVILCKTDGFKKKGSFEDADSSFVRLRLFNGTEELIPLVAVSSIIILG